VSSSPTPVAQGQLHGPVTLVSAAVACAVVVVLTLGPQWVLAAAVLPWVVGLVLMTAAPTRAVGLGVLASGLVLPAVFLGINLATLLPWTSAGAVLP
jgi:hypothetical protein